MESNLFIVLMILLAAGNLWLGSRASKTAKTEDDFYLSGRNMGMIPLVLTILATQLGGGTILGAAEEAYHKGWVVLLYPLGTCIGLLAVAMGFGAKVRHLNLSTISELYEKYYQSKTLRKVSSIFSIVTLFVILVAQGIAARKFFGAIGYDEPWFFIAFWLVLVIYTVMGGLAAVVNTDILQVLFMMGAFFMAFAFFSVNSVNLPVSHEVFSSQTDLPWIGWLLMPMLFMFIEQDMAQRFFAARTPKMVTQGAVLAAVMMLIVTAIPLYFGIMAAQHSLIIQDGASVLLTAVDAFTNPFVTTFVTVAILMAIISTADTLLCSISSNISYDFPLVKHQKIGWARTITLIIGIVSMVLSYAFTNVVAVLIFAYEISVSALFATVIMAIFGKVHSKKAAYGSIIAGSTAFMILNIYPVLIPREILTQLAAFGAYFILSAVPSRKEQKVVI